MLIEPADRSVEKALPKRRTLCDRIGRTADDSSDRMAMYRK